ncbi:hypothetical protein BH23BAC3_BH23BAC3_31930 [soil metagenome]
MGDQHTGIIEDLINFLENERDMYGPFSVNVDVKRKKILSVPENQVKSGAESTQASAHVDKKRSEVNPKKLSLQEKLDGCSSLEELKNLCAESEQLKTDLEGTNLVFGVGNPEADLMIVGEAPGLNEDQQGEPFVGAAGKLLNKILAAINFDRDDIYIANILKHRPPDNRNPTAEERQRSLPFLLRQIDLISPKIILCLGKVAGTTLLNKNEALRRMRGQFHPYRGMELTVTYHPAALLRNPNWKRPAWEDVQAVRKRYDELGGKP